MIFHRSVLLCSDSRCQFCTLIFFFYVWQCVEIGINYPKWLQTNRSDNNGELSRRLLGISERFHVEVHCQTTLKPHSVQRSLRDRPGSVLNQLNAPDCSETGLELLWNCSGIALELLWKCPVDPSTPLNLLRTAPERQCKTRESGSSAVGGATRWKLPQFQRRHKSHQRRSQ